MEASRNFVESLCLKKSKFQENIKVCTNGRIKIDENANLLIRDPEFELLSRNKI